MSDYHYKNNEEVLLMIKNLKKQLKLNKLGIYISKPLQTSEVIIKAIKLLENEAYLHNELVITNNRKILTGILIDYENSII